jgi:hypothetical protein
VLHRPLITTLALGWGVSLLISSTLAPRLFIDGAVSFLFVPFFQLVAFWLVFRRRRAPEPFSVALDRFFATNTPWLLWMFGVGVWCIVQASPRDAALWSGNEVLVALAAMVVAAAYSWWLERDLLRGRESLLYRAIAWPAVIFYFLGFSLVPELVWRLP